MFNKRFLFIICLIAVLLTPVSTGFGMVLVSVSNDGAMEHVTPYVPKPTPIQWKHYDNARNVYVEECIDLGITFEEYKASMTDHSMRLSSWFDLPGLHLVDPDDIYVKKVAEHILEVTDGYYELSRITAVCNFVQTSVRYEYDEVLYGGNFIARPMETLYLGLGDCDDTAVLLMSLYLAMGYDAALLDYSDHIAVGVMYNGEYLFCEATSGLPGIPTPGITRYCETPKVYPAGSISDVNLAITDGLGWYRNLVRDISGR